LRKLRGDLDTIALKALKIEPERRYPTVEALAEDLRRFLDGQPIAARRDTLLYHTGKFVARHRFGVEHDGHVGQFQHRRNRRRGEPVGSRRGWTRVSVGFRAKITKPSFSASFKISRFLKLRRWLRAPRKPSASVSIARCGSCEDC
jgi:hypothetical protein